MSYSSSEHQTDEHALLRVSDVVHHKCLDQTTAVVLHTKEKLLHGGIIMGNDGTLQGTKSHYKVMIRQI
jgi:hypothetical protein